MGWAREIATDAVWAVATARTRTDDRGNVVHQYRLVAPFAQRFEDRSVVDNARRFEWVSREAARPVWEAAAQTAEAYETRDLNLVVGVILPIWDRLGGSGQVYRVTVSDGRQFLGRLIHGGKVRSTLAKLGAAINRAWTAQEAIDAVLAAETLSLVNGWVLKRARVAGEYRIELTGPTYQHLKPLEKLGVIAETYAYKTRLYVPYGSDAVMAALLTQHPVAEDKSSDDFERLAA